MHRYGVHGGVYADGRGAVRQKFSKSELATELCIANDYIIDF